MSIKEADRLSVMRQVDKNISNMKKASFSVTMCITTLCSIMAVAAYGDPIGFDPITGLVIYKLNKDIYGDAVKLMNINEGNVLIEFQKEKPIFHALLLKEMFEEDKNPIFIPKNFVSQFDGKDFIYFDDPLFRKAFIEIYW